MGDVLVHQVAALQCAVRGATSESVLIQAPTRHMRLKRLDYKVVSKTHALKEHTLPIQAPIIIYKYTTHALLKEARVEKVVRLFQRMCLANYLLVRRALSE
jgi:hypothetical protein